MIGGIYEIVNTVNGKRYIGSAKSFKKRWRKHRSQLAHGKHPNPRLQAAWNKHGGDAFQFSLMMTVEDPTKLTWWEQRFFDALKPEYNICLTAGSTLGVIPGVETRKKLSKAGKGKPKSPEHRMNMSLASRGKPKSAEAVEKTAAANRGKKRGPLSLEHRAKIGKKSKGRKYGPLSLERKAQISAFHTGRKHTPDALARMSEAQMGNQHWLGRKHTPESKAKIAKGNTGKIVTSETRAKQSAAAILRWEDPEKRAKTVANMVTAKRASTAVADACRKMARAKKGIPRTPKDKAAISAATKGKKKKPLSSEHKAVLSALMTAAHASKRAAGQPWRKQAQ